MYYFLLITMKEITQRIDKLSLTWYSFLQYA